MAADCRFEEKAAAKMTVQCTLMQDFGGQTWHKGSILGQSGAVVPRFPRSICTKPPFSQPLFEMTGWLGLETCRISLSALPV